MSQPPVPPGDADPAADAPPPGEPAAGDTDKPQLKRAVGELNSGLTGLAKPSDREPKIDDTKRRRVEELWRDALTEGARPSSTIGSLATVSLHPDSPTLDWQRNLPRAAIAGGTSLHPTSQTRPHPDQGKVVVDDASGRVHVHHGEPPADHHAPQEAAGEDTADLLDGGTIDAPPEATDGSRVAALSGGTPPGGHRDTTIDLSGTPYAPSVPMLPTIPAPGDGAAPESGVGGQPPVASNAPTLPGRPADAPHPGTRMVPKGGSRLFSGGKNPDEFRIKNRLASGGMGEVYVATQLGLDREVALKRPKRHLSDSEARLEAFVREGTVTGDLEHPSIVPIYQNGVDADGLPFYAMKLVHGIEWRFLLHPEAAQERKDPAFVKLVAQKGAAMDLHAHLDVLLKVCDAVAFAHSRYILHRDLKPENVIVGEYGEVQVMDWGLAIDYRDQTPDSAKALSRSNIRGPAGTPAYMAPEMALGEVGKIGPATDVYLLGAVLYEILTGRPPHGGSKLDRVLYQAAVNEYLPVRQSNLNIAPGLEAIVNKALSTAAGDRYPTVQAFQAALREHLTHEQSLKISTRTTADLDKLTAAAKESGEVAKTLASEAEHNARYVQYAEIVAAFRQALELWPQNAAARAGLIRGLTVFVTAALDGGDLGLAHAQLEPLRAAIDQADALQQETVAALARRLAALEAARQARQRNFKLALAGVAVLAVVLVVGGTWSYINIRAEKNRAEENFTEAEKQRENAEAQRKKAEQNFAEAETQRARAEKSRLEADQQRQAAESNAELARKNEQTAVAEKLEADRQRTEAEKQRQAAETQKAEAEKQRTIADNQRQVAEAKTAEAQEQRELAEANFTEAERQRRAAVLNLGAVDIQRARTLIAVHRDYPQAATFLLRAIENTRSVDSSKPARDLDLVFLMSPRKLFEIEIPSIDRVRLEEDSAALLVSPEQVTWLPLEETTVNAKRKAGRLPNARDFLRVSDGWLILDAQGGLRLVHGLATQPHEDVTAGLQIHPVRIAGLDGMQVTSLTGSSDEKVIALGLANGRIAIAPLTFAALNSGEDTAADAPLVLTPGFTAPAHKGAVSGLSFLAADKQLLTTGADGRLCLWDLEAKKQLRERPAHLGFASALAIDATGTLAATAGPDGAIKVWNLGDFSERLTLQGHLREVGSLAFHPTRPLLASQSFDGTVRLWNLTADPADTPCYATLHVDNPRPTLQVAFQAGKDRLVCLSRRGLQVWDLHDRVDDTPPLWNSMRRPGADLVAADAEQVQFVEDGRLVHFTVDDGDPQANAANDVLGAFHPAHDPGVTLLLTASGLMGPAEKLEPIAPADAGKITAWAHQGDWLLINRGGKFFLANTAKAGWNFVAVDGDKEAVGIALSSNGQYFIWNAKNRMAFSTLPDETGHCVLNFHMPPHRRKILQAAWLPDSRGVILRTGTNELEMVDDSRLAVTPLTGHLAPVRCMTVDPSGRYLASADATGQVRLTDLDDLTGAPLGALLVAPPDQLLFTADGTHLICLAGGQFYRLRLPQAGDEEPDDLAETIEQTLAIRPDNYEVGGTRRVLTPAPVNEPPAPVPPGTLEDNQDNRDIPPVPESIR